MRPLTDLRSARVAGRKAVAILGQGHTGKHSDHGRNKERLGVHDWWYQTDRRQQGKRAQHSTKAKGSALRRK